MAQKDLEPEPKQKPADGKSELVQDRGEGNADGTTSKTELQPKSKRFDYAEGAD
jgi:hypothetical protein